MRLYGSLGGVSIAATVTALGHSRPMHSVPVPIDVRCCTNSDIMQKSQNARGYFPAKRRNKAQSPIDIASSPSPKSPVSSSRDDVAPHMFIRTSRLQLGNFAINDAKRLLQQYRPIASPCTAEIQPAAVGL
jgi:hypothetical protein